MNLTENIKFRVPAVLKRRALRVYKVRHKSEAECGREAILQYIETKEREYKLPPLGKVTT